VRHAQPPLLSTVAPSLPYILVQKESRHWASAPSLCKIFIERSREARIARYWLKSELRFSGNNSDIFGPPSYPGTPRAVARDARRAVVSGENCVMVTLLGF
jgi:hypothetical protein